MKRVLFCLALAACTRDAAPDGGQADAAARDAQLVTTRAPHRLGPVATTPGELFDDFTNPDGDGLALLDKYAGGATFTATIKTVGVDEDGLPVAWIDIDGDNVMSLELAAPVRLEPGARVTVTCRIGGASGALMMVTSCLVRDV